VELIIESQYDEVLRRKERDSLLLSPSVCFEKGKLGLFNNVWETCYLHSKSIRSQ